jgi:hypothetical protein
VRIFNVLLNARLGISFINASIKSAFFAPTAVGHQTIAQVKRTLLFVMESITV